MRTRLVITALIGALGLTIFLIKTSRPAEVTRAVASVQETPFARGATPVANAPVVTAPKSTAPTELEALYALRECYREPTCDFPQTDPRAYEIAVGQAISQGLRNAWAAGEASPAGRAGVIAAAREFAMIDDAFVQEASLRIFADVDIDPKILSVILEGPLQNIDPTIVAQSMLELRRYLGTEGEAAVHPALAEVIAHGGHLAAEAAAQNILPFVNAGSVAVYRRYLEAMPAATQGHRHLENAIAEYERMISGG